MAGTSPAMTLFFGQSVIDEPLAPHSPSWPGEATKLCFAPTSRPSTFFSASKDVDAWHKAGHGGDGVVCP